MKNNRNHIAVSKKFGVVNFTKESDSLREESGGLSLSCRFTQYYFRSWQVV